MQSFILYKSEIALWHWCPLVFSLLLKSVYQMLRFRLLKFHDRHRLVVQCKCICPFLWTPKELKPERHGGRRAGRTSTSLMSLGCGDSAGCCKAPNVLWPTNNTLSFVSQLQLQQLQTPPFTKQTCCLKAVTLMFSPMYSSSGNFPIWAAQRSQMRS